MDNRLYLIRTSL